MSGGSSSAGAPGAPRQATPSVQHESTFTPWSRFTAANQDVSSREAGKLASGVQGDVAAAEQARDTATAENKKQLGSNYESGTDPFNQPTSAGATKYAGSGGEESKGFQQTQQASFAKYKPPEADIKNDRYELNTNTGGDPTTYTQNVAGSKDLESQMGADAWGKLLGQTGKAQGETQALGSETGVQSLLQQKAAAPLAQGGAFDAALLSGAGGPQFNDISNKYKDDALGKALAGANSDAQGRWGRLTGDLSAEQKTRDDAIKAANDAIRNGTADTGVGAPAVSTSGQPDTSYTGYDSYDDFMSSADASDVAHEGGTGLDPMEHVLNELGKAGIYQGQTVAGRFREGVGAGSGLDDQNLRLAFKQIAGESGGAAAKWLFEHMTPQIWAGFKGQNMGAMYATLKYMLEQSGLTFDALGGVHEGGLSGNAAGTASGSNRDMGQAKNTRLN